MIERIAQAPAPGLLFVNAAMPRIARLFRRDSPTDPLVPLEPKEHPDCRLKASELADDRPGHEATDYSSGGNRYEPCVDVRGKKHQRFAREIAERLGAGLAAGEFSALWLFSSSPFLGELKAQLSDAVDKRVQLVLNSDLTAEPPRLSRRLQPLRGWSHEEINEVLT